MCVGLCKREISAAAYRFIVFAARLNDSVFIFVIKTCHSANSQMCILTNVSQSDASVHSFPVDNQMLLNVLVTGRGYSVSNPAL